MSIAVQGAPSTGTTTDQKPVGTWIPSPSGSLRILKIAPTSFFADYGCHVRIFEESLALQDRGHQVAICTYHTGRDLAELDIHRALNTPWRKTVAVGSSLHKLYYDALLSLTSASVAVRRRPDVVHAHLHEGALIGGGVSRALRVPLVFDFQGSLTSEMLDHGFLRRGSVWYGPLRRLEAWINRLPDALITSSRNAADILIREFDYPAGRIYTISDRVNTDRFLPRTQVGHESVGRLRRRLGLPNDRKIVVYLGLLAEYQGTRLLLDAASELVRGGVPVHFLLMGYPGEEMYRALAAGMGLGEHVTFTGRIPYEQAPRYLLLGDVAVSPKMSETEGNGKLLNYMACGLPTVAFDTPVAREILDDLGVYARPGDARALAAALEYVLGDDDAAREIGWRLRQRAITQFSWSDAADRFEEIYRLVCR
ncbi:MAG: glycosyltransferase family 4 protein [Chloroflexi bacterium]|nr:glycosyltransferase family 4 protein [Chloroflexota bacterium]